MVSIIPAFPLQMRLSDPCDVCGGPPDRVMVGAGVAITCIAVAQVRAAYREVN